MKLTEQELATLIRESSRERLVEGGFGPSGVTLKDTPGNAWAIERVKQMRAEVSPSGDHS